jgi:hypothetical protein
MREERQTKDARLYVFARFHAKTGSKPGVEQSILNALEPTRKEPGSLGANIFRSGAGRPFVLHSFQVGKRSRLRLARLTELNESVW